MATHSSTLAWRIPATGEPGGLPSMGSHRVGHDWSGLAAYCDGHKCLMFLFPACCSGKKLRQHPTFTAKDEEEMSRFRKSDCLTSHPWPFCCGVFGTWGFVSLIRLWNPTLFWGLTSKQPGNRHTAGWPPTVTRPSPCCHPFGWYLRVRPLDGRGDLFAPILLRSH